jgi:hypothetical protein
MDQCLPDSVKEKIRFKRTMGGSLEVPCQRLHEARHIFQQFYVAYHLCEADTGEELEANGDTAAQIRAGQKIGDDVHCAAYQHVEANVREVASGRAGQVVDRSRGSSAGGSAVSVY